MISEKLENAINSQINAEFYSEYLYLSMYSYFGGINLQGFKNWMDVQMKEEKAHAMGLLKYLQDRNGKVVLQKIEQPKINWESPLEVFEDVLKHEQLVTSKINEVVKVAEEVNDKAAVSFLDWYLREQVEEEANVENVLKTLKLICGDNHCIYLLDRELSQRTFTEPVID